MTTSISKADALISKNVVLTELNRMIEEYKYNQNFHSAVPLELFRDNLESLPVQPTMESGWISVEDSLPESQGEVLVYTSDNFITTALFQHPRSFSMVFATTPTHWQPLPPPPLSN